MKSKRLALTGGDVVFLDGILHEGTVVLDGEKIKDIFPVGEFKPETSDKIIDCRGSFICPGFIDLHNQGASGFSVMDDKEESIFGMCRALSEHGTTSLLLTPAINKDSYGKLLPVLAECAGKDTGGASILGIHAEGPFINPNKCGCMPADCIIAPDDAIFNDILEKADGKIKEMTIAPELPGALEIINKLDLKGIVASLGHSNATLMEVLKAIDYGASHVTHFFNAMSPIHHREPGLAGAALYSTDLTVEIIPDGFHLHPWIMGLTVQNKGVSRICLITDSMPVTGLPDGEYDSMSLRVKLENGRLSLANDESVLAGSGISMDRAVANMINMLGITISEAVTMASFTPATVLGIENVKGRIEPGYDADIAVLDKTYRTKMTIVKGKIVFNK